MNDTPHQSFTVSATRYLNNLNRDDLREEHFAVHYQAPPVRHADGRTSHSLVMPIMIMSLYLQNRREVAEKVARILNAHWNEAA